MHSLFVVELLFHIYATQTVMKAEVLIKLSTDARAPEASTSEEIQISPIFAQTNQAIASVRSTSITPFFEFCMPWTRLSK